MRSLLFFTFILWTFIGFADADDEIAESSLDEQTIDLNIITESDLIVGSANAPITMIIYDSITCHHCATFNIETFGKLKEKYVDTGKLRVVMRDFPLDIIAFKLSSILKCFDDDFDFYQSLRLSLFKSQRKWIFQRTDEKRMEVAKNILSFANINSEKLDACQNDTQNSDLVLKERQDAIRAGLRATPIFIINGEVFEGLRSLSFFEATFEDILLNN